MLGDALHGKFGLVVGSWHFRWTFLGLRLELAGALFGGLEQQCWLVVVTGGIVVAVVVVVVAAAAVAVAVAVVAAVGRGVVVGTWLGLHWKDALVEKVDGV